ncbi:hypothetical protein [uncultured Mailhella sp.]|uniref:hypothetical protein n=1 Tax=uncultured Mailhella sp. TaxID=1981031 RepID=UPI00260AB068|nr:hypothetical protein [uncultured Mailhella sp.]
MLFLSSIPLPRAVEVIKRTARSFEPWLDRACRDPTEKWRLSRIGSSKLRYTSLNPERLQWGKGLSLAVRPQGNEAALWKSFLQVNGNIGKLLYFLKRGDRRGSGKDWNFQNCGGVKLFFSLSKNTLRFETSPLHGEKSS